MLSDKQDDVPQSAPVSPRSARGDLRQKLWAGGNPPTQLRQSGSTLRYFRVRRGSTRSIDRCSINLSSYLARLVPCLDSPRLLVGSVIGPYPASLGPFVSGVFRPLSEITLRSIYSSRSSAIKTRCLIKDGSFRALAQTIPIC